MRSRLRATYPYLLDEAAARQNKLIANFINRP